MNIGLIAHDSKKTLMQNFCIAYKGILSRHNLFATGTTGRLIEEVTNLFIGNIPSCLEIACDATGAPKINTLEGYEYTFEPVLYRNHQPLENIEFTYSVPQGA